MDRTAVAAFAMALTLGTAAQAQYRANSSSGIMNFNNPQSSLVQTMIDNPYRNRGGAGSGAAAPSGPSRAAPSGESARAAAGAVGRSGGSKVARDAARAAAAAAAIGIVGEIISGR